MRPYRLARAERSVRAGHADDLRSVRKHRRERRGQRSVVAVFREALTRTEDSCRQDELGGHWDAFERWIVQAAANPSVKPDLADIARAASRSA